MGMSTITDPEQQKAFDAYIVAKAGLKAEWRKVESVKGEAYTAALVRYMALKATVSKQWKEYERQYQSAK